jgi:hypothetical protein
MQVVNNSLCAVDATQAIDAFGKPWLTVIAKGTYVLPDLADGVEPPFALRPERSPGLLLSDEFVGEPGYTAPMFEADLAPFKPRCDLLFKGSAHAPFSQGRPQAASSVDVALRLQNAQGEWLVDKRLRVHGKRQWLRQDNAWVLSTGEAFVEQALHYGIAFGGAWSHDDLGTRDPSERLVHPMNLVGRGFARDAFLNLLKNAPAHQTERWLDGRLEVAKSPDAPLAPAAFGPVARAWQPRLKWAGTYDQHWKDEIFPLLPPDFDDRFHQAASEDQQLDYPQGGELITLVNLVPSSARTARSPLAQYRLRVPRRRLPMAMLTRQRDTVVLEPHIDTLMVDTDAMRLHVTWRARTRLRRSLNEVHTVVVGPYSSRWWYGQVSGNADCATCGGSQPPDTEQNIESAHSGDIGAEVA